MLKSLEIKNYAIIEQLTIEFDDKLNIITGETGAGKSILLGALGLTLGERVDTKVLYNKDIKCFVEAVFQIKNNSLKKHFEENDLDFEQETSIRREIAVNGKSRAFINDTPVTLSVLRSISEKLVNLHSQQETGLLNEQGFQISFVDFNAKNDTLLEEYRKEWKKLKALLKEQESLKLNNATLQKDLDFNLFQLKEINEANLGEETIESLENELRVLNNSEDIKNRLFEVVNGLENEDQSVLSILNGLSASLNKISSLSKTLETLSGRIESVLLEIQDIKAETESLAQETDLDEERIALLNEKVNNTNKLLQKHNLLSVDDLKKLQEELVSKTDSVADFTNLLAQIENDISEQERELNILADKLTLSRKKVIPNMENLLTKTLQNVGMPNANFVISQTKKDAFDAFGKDGINFLFSSNKGFEPQNLTKIASGGELSRVMLSIKSLLAGSTNLPTLIFDEIDTGISGEVASQVGDVFKGIAKNHQLISITHLPQIAAKANRHFFIYKEDRGEKTKTKVATLSPKQHIKAIARMLSGTEITEISLENARVLVG